MNKPERRPFAAALVAAALLLSLFPHAASAAPARTRAAAAAARQAKEQKKEEPKKEEKPKLTKQERKYQEIKKFSTELYNKDEEFRNHVDKEFADLMRRHTDLAFAVNTSTGFDRRMADGDTLRMNETLYDNPLAQDYMNRLGQSLVPSTTTRLYAFKIRLNPIPEAHALSTGTIYVSTGLLSQVDNEAQLAYVLGHEIAHVENEHWREDVLVVSGVPEYNEKQAKKRAMWGAIIGVATAGVTRGMGGSGFDAMNNANIAISLAPTLLKAVIPNALTSSEWEPLQEDEADQLGLKYVLERNYDPREAPKLLATMQRMVKLDRRVGLGFMGDPDRLDERVKMVSSIINGISAPRPLQVGAVDLVAKRGGGAAAASSFNAEMKAKLDAGELIGSTGEFEAVMAELKRDNGLRAFYYDMFQMARDNLEESLLIRSNDPLAHLYYGKVLKLTARSGAEKSRALAEFVRAIELDRRRVLPEARLHRALALIENKESSLMPEIVSALKEYVGLYQRVHGGAPPPNMDVIYDYMQEAGEMNWSAPRVTNISTRDVEPVNVSMPGQRPAPSATPAEPQPVGRRP
jgi:predicted Zn-dependent protease